MVQGDTIPDTDHVARYCRKTAINEDGKPTGVAFRPKPIDTYLSVSWLENTGRTSRDAQVLAARTALAAELTLAKSGQMAVLHIEKTRTHVADKSEDKRCLHFSHEPTPTNPYHSGISNLSADDVVIADLIAEVVCACYSVQDSYTFQDS